MLGIILDQRGLRCWKRFCRHSETGPIASGLILQSGSGAYGGFLSPDPCTLRHYGLHGELENAYMCINYRNNFNTCWIVHSSIVNSGSVNPKLPLSYSQFCSYQFNRYVNEKNKLGWAYRGTVHFAFPTPSQRLNIAYLGLPNLSKGFTSYIHVIYTKCITLLYNRRILTKSVRPVC